MFSFLLFLLGLLVVVVVAVQLKPQLLTGGPLQDHIAQLIYTPTDNNSSSNNNDNKYQANNATEATNKKIRLTSNSSSSNIGNRCNIKDCRLILSIESYSLCFNLISVPTQARSFGQKLKIKNLRGMLPRSMRRSPLPKHCPFRYFTFCHCNRHRLPAVGCYKLLPFM